MEEAIRQQGYINFTLIPTLDADEGKKIVNLTINIDEGLQYRVNRIHFTGDATTPDDVIRCELMVQEGQVFNSSLWDLSLQRLNRLGYFEEITDSNAEIKLSSTEPTLDINLNVKQKSRR